VEVAIVGLRTAGKTTVFEALTASHGGSGDARGEHIGVVKIPDERLERLAAFCRAPKITPLEVRLHDLPPIFEKGAGLPPPAVESLSRADALLHVLRAFERGDVPHPIGTVDPVRDLALFEAELALSDLAVIERRIERLDITVRSARPGEREAGEREMETLKRAKSLIEDGKPLRAEQWLPQHRKLLNNYGLLSLKPALVLVNVGEAQIADADRLARNCWKELPAEGDAVVWLCAKLEAELTELPLEDAALFRSEMGLPEGAVQRVLSALRDVLRLVTFFTINEREARAWTVPAGATVLEAAGRIHSDMERGFIRAEVIPWDRLLERGSHAEARRHGELRTQGRQYIVQEGDVINVLFNV
jgi:GTP-binding protein YchF